MVNHALTYGNKKEQCKAHMHAHVYHEGVAKKGAHNMVSLNLKTLNDSGILWEDDISGELVIIFDNCLGQNKNNMVMELLVYLTEKGYFKIVQCIFLISGHTKNPADRLFDVLK